jgi:hypothetical protein
MHWALRFSGKGIWFGGLLLVALCSFPQPAHADDYEFVGDLTLLPYYGVHPTVQSETPGLLDVYAESLSGSFGNAVNWSVGAYPYIYSPGGNGVSAIMFSPTAPGPGDSVGIGGVPEGLLTPTEGPSSSAGPNEPIYGYYSSGGPGGFAGYTGYSFDVSGVGGTIANLTVGGPGTLELSSLDVTTSASFTSDGGVPVLNWDPSIPNIFGSFLFNGFSASAQEVTGG